MNPQETMLATAVASYRDYDEMAAQHDKLARHARSADFFPDETLYKGDPLLMGRNIERFWQNDAGTHVVLCIGYLDSRILTMAPSPVMDADGTFPRSKFLHIPTNGNSFNKVDALAAYDLVMRERRPFQTVRIMRFSTDEKPAALLWEHIRLQGLFPDLGLGSSISVLPRSNIRETIQANPGCILDEQTPVSVHRRILYHGDGDLFIEPHPVGQPIGIVICGQDIRTLLTPAGVILPTLGEQSLNPVCMAPWVHKPNEESFLKALISIELPPSLVIICEDTEYEQACHQALEKVFQNFSAIKNYLQHIAVVNIKEGTLTRTSD